ncbi:MAG: MFS transporter [Haloferacaceae archaeon]
MDANDRAIAGFTAISHLMFHVYELAIPLFVVIWLDVFAVSPAVLGTIVGAGYGLIGVGAMLSGALSDVYGSKTLVLASMVGMGGGFLLMSAWPSVVTVALGILAWGAGASLYHPAGLSLLTRGSKERGTALAYHGAAGNVGTAVGPFLAALLLTFVGWRLAAGLFVLPAVVGVLVGLRFEFDETAAVDATIDGGATVDLGGLARQSKALFTGGFVIAFAVMMAHGVYSRGVLSFLPEILADLPLFRPVALFDRSFEPSQYVYAGLLLLGGGGQYLGGRLTDRTATEPLLIGSYAALVAVSVLFVPASAAGLVPLLAVCGALGFLIYMTAPIRQALVATYADADVHGLSFGYTYLGVYGVGALGPSLAGLALTHATTEVFFLLFAGVAATVILLGVVLLVREW